MIRYHSVQPESLKSSYKEFDTVDFVLTFENRRMLGNSIRLEADVVCTTDGTTQFTTQEVFIDPMTGAHLFIESIQTELQTTGVIENLQEYPRFVRMSADTTMVQDDTMNSENVCEMRTPGNQVSKILLRGITERSDVTTVVNDNDFSIKPKFVLNSVFGNETSIPYSKTGAVRVTVKLARNAAVFFGDSVNTDYQYSLSNLRLCFTSLPDDGSKDKIMMRTKLNIKQTIQSKFANVSTKVPSICNAVSCSFQQLTNENSAKTNNVQTEVVPNIQELQFLFNDSTNTYVTYQLRSSTEWLMRYIESFVYTGDNNASLHNLKANNSFGVGLAFRDFVDLSNQKFNIQLTSDIVTPYVMYLYFHSVMQL